jgi:hypothetical protein
MSIYIRYWVSWTPARERTSRRLDVLALGGSVLYILRPRGNEYEFIGECYVHGLMDGEALQGVNLEKGDFESFTLA